MKKLIIGISLMLLSLSSFAMNGAENYGLEREKIEDVIFGAVGYGNSGIIGFTGCSEAKKNAKKAAFALCSDQFDEIQCETGELRKVVSTKAYISAEEGLNNIEFVSGRCEYYATYRVKMR